jgi:hypothetical protein
MPLSRTTDDRCTKPRKLKLAVGGCAPQYSSVLTVLNVELQPIGMHSDGDVVNARRQKILKLDQTSLLGMLAGGTHRFGYRMRKGETGDRALR